MPLFFSPGSLDAEGREFLASRFLSIPEAIKRGCASCDGYMHFAFTRNGEIVRWKSRAMSNKKMQTYNYIDDKLKDTFKMPFFSQFKGSTSDYLIITEGEFDCIALAQLGASNCVSLPSGAGSIESAIRNNYEFLQQFKLIYIATDMDSPGEEAAKKAEKLISPLRYRRLVLPCKDANEWIIKNPEVDMTDLQLLMQNARRIDNPAITDGTDFSSDYYDPVDLGVKFGVEKLDAILGGMRKGEVTVLCGDTGSGKTSFALYLMKMLAEKGKGVWINSFEMNPKTIHRKMASLILKKKMKFDAFSDEDRKSCKDYYDVYKVFLNISNSNVRLAQLRNLFEQASYVYNIDYVLLDHLDYLYESDGKNTSEAITEAMRCIHELAMEFQMGIILVVHPKQLPEGQEVGMSDLKGSSGIKQYADNVVIITRMDRLDPLDLLRVKIRVCKNRLCGFERFFYMRYVPEFDSYAEGLVGV
jgi:twinkle protein